MVLMYYPIVETSAKSEEVQTMIIKLDDLMHELYSHYLLDEDDNLEAYLDSWTELAKPNVVFFGARNDDGTLIGMGAIKDMEYYSELKRIYVEPDYRGQGVADRIVAGLELCSAHKLIKLETGTEQPDAIKFFTRIGYNECAHFGCYGLHPANVYMEKHL